MNFNNYVGMASAFQVAGEDNDAADMFLRALDERPNAFWIYSGSSTISVTLMWSPVSLWAMRRDAHLVGLKELVDVPPPPLSRAPEKPDSAAPSVLPPTSLGPSTRVGRVTFLARGLGGLREGKPLVAIGCLPHRVGHRAHQEEIPGLQCLPAQLLEALLVAGLGEKLDGLEGAPFGEIGFPPS